VVVTPHLGASTVEAQDKAGQTIAEQVVLALRGEFVPFAVNLAATEANSTVQPFMPLAERLGRLFTALAGGTVDTLEISYEGQIADYDCRVLTLSVLKGVLGPVVDHPVSFVNAPQLAEERGLVVREITSSSARDYVNLIELRGHSADRSTHVAGTLYGKQDAPRIVAIDDYIVDLPPSSHMLVVRNTDIPGMVGRVGSILGIDHGINIDELDLGRGPSGDVSLMLVSTSTPVPPEVVSQLRTAWSTPAPSSSTDGSALGRAEIVGRRGVNRRVAAVGLGALVARAARLVEDAAGQLRLHRVAGRARAVDRLHPPAGVGRHRRHRRRRRHPRLRRVGEGLGLPSRAGSVRIRRVLLERPPHGIPGRGQHTHTEHTPGELPHALIVARGRLTA
jgi:D-3-phosphoglycerate dehydrogenase